MAVYTLENTVMEYAWGDPKWIPELLGRPNPKGIPQAELWMGAHSQAPSRVKELEGATLDNLIEKDPVFFLGIEASRRHGDRLPFLFKILAAGKPLSIQAHPDKKQAEEGFERENAAGIPVDDPVRNYKDRNHKPEIICALTPFWAVRGFREARRIRELLSPVAEGSVSGALEAMGDPSQAAGIRDFFERLMTSAAGRLAESVEKTVLKIRDAGTSSGIPDDEVRWVLELAREYPGDPGCLCPLILNLVSLDPGEAMYLPAGELHAYLHGLGIELMANSNNVLRGGLTVKHVDVPELLKTLHFRGAAPRILKPEPLSSSEAAYPVPTDEFALSRITLGDGDEYRSPKTRSLDILFCLQGSCRISSEQGSASGSTGAAAAADAAEHRDIGKGTAVLLPAAGGRYRISGAAVLYKAAVP